MAKGIYNKSENLQKHYNLFKRYSHFPESKSEQRKIVREFYNVIHCKNGVVNVDGASEERIYHVAKRIYDKSQKMIKGSILERVSNLNFNKEHYEVIENLSRILDDCENPEVIGVVNNELKRHNHGPLELRIDTSFP